jgi:hypothetical protein
VWAAFPDVCLRRCGLVGCGAENATGGLRQVDGSLMGLRAGVLLVKFAPAMSIGAGLCLAEIFCEIA